MLLMEMLTGRPAVVKNQMDSLIKKHLSRKVSEMSDTMIINLMDPVISLDAPQIKRARELLSLILKCMGHEYSIEQVLQDLENIYSRMYKRI